MTTYTIIQPITIPILGFLFSYFILYKTNRFLGNMGYLATSIIYLRVITEGNSAIPNSENAIGFILLIGSIIHLLYDLIKGK